MIDRTGTWEYMSIEAILGEPGFVHTYYHDLQSILYVFIWIVADRELKDELSEDWSSKRAALLKVAHMTNQMMFDKLLEGIEEQVYREVVRAVAGGFVAQLGQTARTGGVGGSGEGRVL